MIAKGTIYFLLVNCFLILGNSKITAGQINNEISFSINSKAELDSAMNVLILQEFLENPADPVKVGFTLKIDSLGEVHSAHIMWSLNIKFSKYYAISSLIENSYNLKFLYKKYKDEPRSGKYVKCNYAYQRQ